MPGLARAVNDVGDFFFDRELNRMVRRITGDIPRPSDWPRRSGDVFDHGRVDRDSQGASRVERGINRSGLEPSVVEVSRIWDSAGSKPKGRFEAYDQFGRAPLGMYIDMYA